MDTNVTNADTRAAIGVALRKTAMLATVTIGMWSGARGDKDIIDKAKADAGAVGNVGRAYKNMLAGADTNLKAAQAAFTAVRTAHYDLTLPWMANPQADRKRGPRMLATALFDRYAGEMGSRKKLAIDALETFIAGYPDDIVRAKQNLAALADAVYPTEAEVRAQFHIDYEFAPMPAGNDFQGLPETTLRALSIYVEGRQKIMLDGARRAMITEIRDRVGLLAERLATEDGAFRASTVEAVRELTTLLPAWNLEGEAEIERINAAISTMMTGTTADGIREDKAERTHVATQAQAIVEMVGKL
jgi:hypothetical protein